MSCNLITEISGNECIGDSRVKINTNFTNLETTVCVLSTNFATLDVTVTDGLNNVNNDVNALEVQLSALAAEVGSPPVGSIVYAETSPSPKWVRCSNQVLPISSYSSLFSVLGAKYGGNGSTTFRLPPAHNLKTTNALGTPFPNSGNCGKATLLQDGRVFYAGAQTSQAYIGTITGNTINWQTVTPALPEYRDGSNTHTLSDGRVIVIGGNSNTVYYGTISPSSPNVAGGWLTTSPSTLPLSQPHPISGFLPDGRIVIAGSTAGTLIGTINLTTNPISIAWITATGVPADKNTGAGGILPDGRILVTAGYTNARTFIGTVNGINITWEELPQFPTGSYYYLRGGIILPDGRFFSVGGGSTSSRECFLGTVINNEIEWTSGPPDPYGRWLSTSVALLDGRVLTFGGAGITGTYFTRFNLYAYIKVSQ